MLLLVFNVAAQAYAIPAKSVVEVVPAVPLQPQRDQLPTLNYRGGRVPVLDLRQHYLGEPTTFSLTTRIVLVGESGQTPALGLLAEQVTDTLRPRMLRAVDSAPAPTPLPARCLHDESGGVLYLLDLERLIAESRCVPDASDEAEGG